MILKLNDIPGLADLTRDYLNAEPSTASFFNGHFQDCSSFKRIANRLLVTDRPHRSRIIEILTDQNRALNAGPKSMDNIELLSRPETLAVVTGQQCGLFGGPLYIFYKALTTVKLARTLAERLQRPVVPVFYLVSEDHDFDEIKWSGILDANNNYRQFNYQPEGLAERVPAADITLDESVNTLFSEFSDALPNSEFKSGIMDRLSRAYRPGEHMHTAFARWYLDLLGEYGLIVFDSADPRIKPLVQPLFDNELKTGFSNRVLAETNTRLEAAGYHVQITLQENRPNLFILENGRHGLEKEGDGYINLHNHKHYSVQELLDHPENLSPKVTLRPLVQDTLFPTLAYVGGPGEIAYWAQLKGLYDHLDMTMPVVYPRAAFTLLLPKIRKHLETHQLDVTGVIRDPQKAVKSVLEKQVPIEIREQFNTLQSLLQERFDQLKASATGVDPTLGNVVDKTAGNLENQVSGLQNKVMRAVEQRESVTASQLDAVVNHLLPDNGLQERKLGALNYLIMYDTGLLDRLLESINIGTFEHNIMEL